MISTGRVRDASAAGQPAAVREDDVIRLLHERRAEASRRQPNALEFARFVRRTIWPDEELDEVVLADGRRDIANPDQAQRIISAPRGRTALSRLTEDAVALFGRAAVETVAMPRESWKANCRWCFADASARALGGLRPVDSPAYRALLGANPCAQDVARWRTEADERKAADRRLAQQLAQQERAAAQSTARQEFTAAQGALQAATARAQTAAQRLASVDPSVARQAATERARTAALKAAQAGFVRTRRPHCACTAETLCADHARQLRTRRPGTRR